VLEELLACDGYPFIRRAYWVFLGREPDPSGLANYLEQLRSGTPKVRVLRELAQSPEGAAKGAKVLTEAIPTAESPAVPRRSSTHIAKTWDHLLVTHGRTFISCAYQTLLGRDPDPEGLRFYLGQLRSGASKVQILAQLRHSAECETRIQNQERPALFRRIDREIFKSRLARVPILGWLLRATLGLEGDTLLEKRLRRIEYLLLTLGREDDTFAGPSEKSTSPAPTKEAKSIEQLESATLPDRHGTDDTAPQTTVPATAALRSLSTPANWGRENFNG
jgi:hypothetical protein